jgi:hypothetical protein
VKVVRWKHKEIGNPYTEPSSADQPRVIAETLDAQLTWLCSLRANLGLPPVRDFGWSR